MEIFSMFYRLLQLGSCFCSSSRNMRFPCGLHAKPNGMFFLETWVCHLVCFGRFLVQQVWPLI